MSDSSHDIGTRAVHAGEAIDEQQALTQARALEPPLVLSSAYNLGTADDAAGAFRGENELYIYGRWRNPGVESLERKLANLESAEAAVATASGMAAVTGALLSRLVAGDHVVAPWSCYGETSRLLREHLPKLGITTSFVDGSSVEAYRTALTPQTRVVYAETPSNPVMKICDLEALAKLSHEHGAELICDNTFATPVHQRPIELGADLVLHSMTKALCGHGDAIGGVICGSKQRVHAASELVVKGFGGVLAPFNAFLISRGVRTLALRQRQASESALELAGWLSEQPAVAQVHYPGLGSHPGHEIAARQMQGFGALLSFELRGGLEAGKRVLEGVELIEHAVSLGDVRSLITHPASTTASTMPVETRRRADIGDGLLRLSVGIEAAADLRRDLERALGRVG
ncbi:MAG: aminotransferase class I/II-fold pyridoxal phosphate-dependent enzyme [Polyangiaceae bacterium]